MGKKKWLMLVCALVLIANASIATAKTIYVPDDYPTIQKAIDYADFFDTIIVRDGTYYETVNVHKTLTLQSENGPGSTKIIGKPEGAGVVMIWTPWTNVSGFTITSPNRDRPGILMSFAHEGYVTDNVIEGMDTGIFMKHCWNYTIARNTIITTNTIGKAIVMREHSSNNTISDNVMRWVSPTNGTSNGIYAVYSCDDNVIRNNTIEKYYFGIDIAIGKRNQIYNNKLYDNIMAIGLHYKTNGTLIHDNEIIGNYWGLYSYWNGHNKIMYNNFTGNRYGIVLTRNSVSNWVYCNNFDNEHLNGEDNGSDNRWFSPIQGTYEYNGTTYTNYMGNFWSDYNGTDADGDGIGDAPYNGSGNLTDPYPLVKRISEYHGKPIPPVPELPSAVLLCTGLGVIIIWIVIAVARKKE